MSIPQHYVQFHILDKIAQMNPRSIKEYNELFSSSITDITDVYDIVRIENYVWLPSVMPFSDIVPSKNILFESDADCATELIHFQYPLEADGGIRFYVYIDNNRILTPDDHWELGIIFRQYYYIFSSVVLRLSCQKLIMADYNTGIPNIKSYFQFCNMIIAKGKIRQYTALYFNIHNFKSVHKSLTYLQGNEIMKKYCDTIAGAVSKKEIVARLGGDNFVALILDKNTDYFFDLIQNMIVKYKRKEDQPLTFMFGAYIGAVKLTDERNAGEIMMHSSVAYQAARESRSLIGYYTPEVSSAILERKLILSNFMNSIKNKDFFVVYQPKVEISTRTLIGAEALVRWNNKDQYILPSEFIPVLEKDGCITTLDYYVLEEVCRMLQKMLQQDLEPVPVSVNFSKRHLANNKLVEEILDLIDQYHIPHKYIKVELTESEDYHNSNIMQSVVEELNMHGIKTAIDDFGTGYSSLAMLNSLQLDELKIDQSFLPQGEFHEQDKTFLMLRGVVNLAKDLGLTLVAEGVETPLQLQLLNDMGCDAAQGYIFDKPLAEEEFITRVTRRVYPTEAK